MSEQEFLTWTTALPQSVVDYLTTNGLTTKQLVADSATPVYLTCNSNVIEKPADVVFVECVSGHHT